MKTIKVIIYIFLPAILMLSCTTSNDVVSDGIFQKRKYTKGFFYNNKAPVDVKTTPKQDEQLMALKHKSINQNKLNSTIQLVDSKEDFEIDPTLIVSVNDYVPNYQLIESIPHHNKTEGFVQSKGKRTYKRHKISNEDEPEMESFGLVSFCLAMGGLLMIPIFFPVSVLAGILSIVFGGISLSKHKKNPDKYKGKKLAVAALITGVLEILVLVLLFAILIVSIGI